MKKFFLKIKDWFVRHKPSKRRLIQVYVALLYNANLKGFFKGTISKSKTKYACVPGLNCYSCPGAVGSCPLGSLQNAFAQSGTGGIYYIIGIIGLFGLIFARSVCGFLCPVGLGQELLHKIPTPKIKKGRPTRVLSYLKYVILAVMVAAVPLLYGLQGVAVPAFCKFICPAGTFEGGLGLLLNPANWSGSRDLLSALNWIFSWKFALLITILVFCVFMYRPFCRFLCPLGAIYGFFNKIAFLGVKVDKVKCTDCGLCVKHCEMDIKHVGDHECIHCGKCIGVCPVKAISWKTDGYLNKLKGKKNKQKNVPVIDTTAGLATETATVSPIVGAKVNTVNLTAEITPPPEKIEPTVSVNEQAATVNEQTTANTEATASMQQPATKNPKTKRTKAFWVQFAAWCAALIVLAGTLTYFNAFAKETQVENMLIGSECPDFSLNTYGVNSSGAYRLLNEKFTLSEHRGSVVVINFWATWCGPCVVELPFFGRVAEDYPEVKIVAIHENPTGEYPNPTAVATYIKNNGWNDWNVTFMQDEIEGADGKTFIALGGNSALPVTLIIDREGKIAFIWADSISYEKLRTEVEKVLNAE